MEIRDERIDNGKAFDRGGRVLKAYCGIGASPLGENEIAAWKQEQYFQYEVRI